MTSCYVLERITEQVYVVKPIQRDVDPRFSDRGCLNRQLRGRSRARGTLTNQVQGQSPIALDFLLFSIRVLAKTMFLLLFRPRPCAGGLSMDANTAVLLAPWRSAYPRWAPPNSDTGHERRLASLTRKGKWDSDMDSLVERQLLDS